MSRGSAQHPTAVSPATFALFGVSAIVVGGIGSARLWEAHIGGPPMPLERMLPLVVVAELLAYFAIMLARSYNPVGAAQVAAGVLVGLAARGGQAALAALVAGPAEAERFLGALGHYHAQYYPGVLLQIGVACLFLWLVKGAFEARPAVLAPATREAEPPPASEAQEAAEAAPAENGPQRRRELIEQLMRREEDADEPEPAPEEAPEAPPAQPPQQEPSVPAPEAPAPTEEEPGPPEAGPPEPAPYEEPQSEPAAEPPAEQPPAPAPEEPERKEARPARPPALSARESVIQALREEDDEPEELLRLPLEALPVAPPQPPEAAPPPEEEVAAPLPASSPSALDAISAVTQAAGAGAALMERSAAGRLLIIAAPEAPDAGAVAAPCEACLAAAACLCAHCGLGDLRRIYLRPTGGYVAATAIVEGDRGAWATLALPPEANLGSADDALRRLEELAGTPDWPAWPPPAPPDLTPAYPDPDLERRIGPLFEWVPQAAGLALTLCCAGGLQVATLTSGGQASEATAAAMARAQTDAEQLCSAFGLPDCGMGLVAGHAGVVAWASADVAGQRLLVCLVRLGAGAPGPVSIQLRQIIRGLGDMAGTGAVGAE